MLYNRRYSHSELANPDFVKLAEAYGAEGYRITKKDEVAPVLQAAIQSRKPVLMDFVIEREENVLPFVPPARR
ncbi:hypothetical protein N752_10595 [Desulforamulus aquiferis]|nr:thiamine pyrophosphate-dependent enzyme [Desulforamulus aquiferis]RYD05235.1 hypothetical protein N752_10595 [Desulforamulus aquiferis]